ncbi:hypothetical protein ACQY0O_004812 [Thecaphora frezii]
MRLDLSFAGVYIAVVLLLAGTTTQPVNAAPLPGITGSIGDFVAEANGRFGGVLGGGDQRIQGLAKTNRQLLYDETFDLMLRTDPSEKGFLASYKKNRLGARLNALEKEDTAWKIGEKSRVLRAAEALAMDAEMLMNGEKNARDILADNRARKWVRKYKNRYLTNTVPKQVERIRKQQEALAKMLKESGFENKINEAHLSAQAQRNLRQYRDQTLNYLEKVDEFLAPVLEHMENPSTKSKASTMWQKLPAKLPRLRSSKQRTDADGGNVVVIDTGVEANVWRPENDDSSSWSSLEPFISAVADLCSSGLSCE